MDELLKKIASLGTLGIVLIVAIGNTGLVGAAAITAALASLGGPFGMIGGIFALGTIGLITHTVSEYGLEEVIKVCKQASAHDFISELPSRYDTLLEENASNLSGGQRQRLAIARALLKKPDIIILDEATSNLDSTTEKNITDMLKQLESEGVTIIMIAHRLSTIQHAHQIFVMEKGHIIEQGSHEELLLNKNNYYILWKNQTVHAEHIELQSQVARGMQHE